MSVTVRPYRRGGWEVDITLRSARRVATSGTERAPVASKSAAQRWGEDREREWFHELTRPRPSPHPRRRCPRWQSSRHDSSTGMPGRTGRSRVASPRRKRSSTSTWCRGSGRSGWTRSPPRTCSGSSTGLRDRAPKTVNNVLTVLNMLLKKAVEWDVIERMPCAVKLLPIPKPSMGFYDFDEYERLVDAAAGRSQRVPDRAARRRGRTAMRRNDGAGVARRGSRRNGRLCVQRSEWKGHVTAPKGGRLRYVPMTIRLATALRDHRHLRSARVLCRRWRSALRGCREASRGTGGAAGAAHRERRPSAAAYVLLASGDAGGAGTGDSGAGRTQGSDHDAAVHAPQSGGARRGDPAAGSTGSTEIVETLWRRRIVIPLSPMI